MIPPQSETVATLGAFSYPKAAALLGVSPDIVRRWSKGYTRKVKFAEAPKQYAPLLQAQHEAGYVTFLELIELVYCREFKNLGVHLTTIRKVAESLSKEVGPYPFASREVLVAGRALVARVAPGLGLDLATKQHLLEFGDWIRPNVTYDANDRIGRLIVAGDELIVLDPRVRFGEPVLTSRPVPTSAIANLFIAQNRDARAVADYFRISEREVQAAARFEADPRRAFDPHLARAA